MPTARLKHLEAALNAPITTTTRTTTTLTEQQHLQK